MIDTLAYEETALRYIKNFERKYGEEILRLALHAALPVVINADLVHLLRINFFVDSSQPLPYTTEADLLLSSLCHNIGDGLYEIAPNIRDVLLQRLVKEYPHERILDVAMLLWQYNERYAPWADRPVLERAQQLTALNFLDPLKAGEWLAEAEVSVGLAPSVERDWFIAMRRDVERTEEIIFSSFANAQTTGSNTRDNKLLSQLVMALMKIPGIDSIDSRTALLVGIPRQILASLARSNASRTDISFIVDKLAHMRLQSGESALLIFINNVLNQVEGFTVAEELRSLKKQLEAVGSGTIQDETKPSSNIIHNLGLINLQSASDSQKLQIYRLTLEEINTSLLQEDMETFPLASLDEFKIALREIIQGFFALRLRPIGNRLNMMQIIPILESANSELLTALSILRKGKKTSSYFQHLQRFRAKLFNALELLPVEPDEALSLELPESSVAPQPCKVTSSVRGIEIETFSGSQTSSDAKIRLECTIGSRTDIRHIVTIRNLRTYPVDIVCTGSLKASPRGLLFQSPITSDTDNTWQSRTALGSNSTHTYSHVTLLSLQPNTGNEAVDTEIEVFWPASGTRQKISLSFIVNR
jgi:hypothetical protein